MRTQYLIESLEFNSVFPVPQLSIFAEDLNT